VQLVLPKNREYVRTTYDDMAPILGSCTRGLKLLEGQDKEIDRSMLEIEQQQMDDRVEEWNFPRIMADILKEDKPSWKVVKPCKICLSEMLLATARKMAAAGNQFTTDMKMTLDN
jgi:hypothetical protein